MNYSQIILKPVVTEKATFIKEADNKVSFLVHPKANKIEIKKAVEAAFPGVKVLDVNVTVKKPVSKSRGGRVVGKTPGHKKAFVTLAEGSKIEFFEGV